MTLLGGNGDGGESTLHPGEVSGGSFFCLL